MFTSTFLTFCYVQFNTCYPLLQKKTSFGMFTLTFLTFCYVQFNTCYPLLWKKNIAWHVHFNISYFLLCSIQHLLSSVTEKIITWHVHFNISYFLLCSIQHVLPSVTEKNHHLACSLQHFLLSVMFNSTHVTLCNRKKITWHVHFNTCYPLLQKKTSLGMFTSTLTSVTEKNHLSCVHKQNINDSKNIFRKIFSKIIQINP